MDLLLNHVLLPHPSQFTNYAIIVVVIDSLSSLTSTLLFFCHNKAICNGTHLFPIIIRIIIIILTTDHHCNDCYLYLVVGGHVSTYRPTWRFNQVHFNALFCSLSIYFPSIQSWQRADS